jgi:glycosyltransferase involved in cell wall biosynthesis
VTATAPLPVSAPAVHRPRVRTRALFTMTFGDRLGGCEEFLWTYLRNVDRDRIDPLVVFNDDGPLVDDVRALGIRTKVIKPGRLREVHRELAAVARLRSTFLREDPHVIVSWFTKAHLYAAPAAALAGMADRLVWFQHTLPGGTRLDRPITALPARAIGASSDAGARAQRRLWPRRPTFVVRPGIDPPRRTPPAELAELRARLGIPEGRRVIGVVGRLQPWKRQHLAIEALAELRRLGYDVHGLIVGGDAYEVAPQYEPELRRLVRRLVLEDAVTFTGQVGCAHPYMELMDVLVSSSRTEPFGIVLVEALALGVPAVAFDCEGGPLEILDGGAGLFAREGCVPDLARQVERLLADPGLRDSVVAAGHERFAERFTSERMAEALTARLEALAVRA